MIMGGCIPPRPLAGGGPGRHRYTHDTPTTPPSDLPMQRHSVDRAVPQAIECGFDSLDVIMDDPDLENVRKTLEFKELKMKVRSSKEKEVAAPPPQKKDSASPFRTSSGRMFISELSQAAVDALKVPFRAPRTNSRSPATAEPSSPGTEKEISQYEQAAEQMIRKVSALALAVAIEVTHRPKPRMSGTVHEVNFVPNGPIATSLLVTVAH